MKTTFITLTNEGYLPYTFNCLKSLEKIGINDLKCYAIGKSAYGRVKRKKYAAELINDERNTTFQVFRTGNWADVTFYKFEIIYENLKKSDFVCFTDGDIVFKDPAIFDYCRDMINEKDLLIQNDSMDEASDQNLCSGFMFIRSNENTLKYFNPEFVRNNSAIVEGWDDQVYINNNKDKLNFGLLPLPLFPNGNYYYKYHEKLSPYLIHFNWLIGHKKLDQFIKYNECYSLSLLYLQKKKKLRSSLKKALRQMKVSPSVFTGRSAT